MNQQLDPQQLGDMKKAERRKHKFLKRALRKPDEQMFRNYCAKYQIRVPEGPAFRIGLHKTRATLQGLPRRCHRDSLRWLEDHGILRKLLEAKALEAQDGPHGG